MQSVHVRLVDKEATQQPGPGPTVRERTVGHGGAGRVRLSGTGRLQERENHVSLQALPSVQRAQVDGDGGNETTEVSAH